MPQRSLILVALAALLAGPVAPETAQAVILRDAAGLSGQEVGACAAGVGDQNGDGRQELLVGSPSLSSSNGRAYLWLGGVDLALAAYQTWSGSGGEEFGRAVAAIGDVNDDGIGDFAVGAPLADLAGNDAGRVYVFYGGLPLPATPAQADRILEGTAGGEEFGFAIAGLGDFNGDGRDDFIVGAPYSNRTGLEAGAAYVFYGSSSGIGTTPDLILTGALAYDHFGWSVAGAGNVLGGSVRCALVGAPANGTGAGMREGSAFVYAGSSSPSPGPNTTSDLTLTSNATNTADNEFGYAVAGAGRWNSDSYDDVAVGAPRDDTAGSAAGRVEVFFGGSGADGVADRYVGGTAANDWFGTSLAGVGDVEGSSYDDLVIGAPNAVAGVGAEAGMAAIFPGGSSSYSHASSLPQVDRELLVADTAAGDRFGWWTAALGDFDGDGLPDYAVTAPFGNIVNSATAGWVQVHASSGLAVPVMLSQWDASWSADGDVALRFSVAVPATDVVVARLTRLVLDDADHVTARVAVAGLAREGAGWAATDRGAGTGDPFAYALDLELHSGQTLSWDRLPGPAGGPPAAGTALQAAVPNPFNPRTSLRWRAPAGASVRCQVVDLRGHEVRTLLAATGTGAWQTVTWDGRTDAGRTAAAGVYLVRLVTDLRIVSRTVVLAK